MYHLQNSVVTKIIMQPNHKTIFFAPHSSGCSLRVLTHTILAEIIPVEPEQGNACEGKA